MRYRLKLKTDSTVEPVSVAELKLHLRVDGTDEDAMIEALGKAARREVERYTQRSLISQTWLMDVDGFPEERHLLLPRSPFLSVESIKYRDEDDVLQTMSSTLYSTDSAGGEEPARVFLVEEETDWPDCLDEPNAVQIEFKAGYGTTAANVPETLKTAIKLLVGNWFENREAVITGTIVAELPLAVKALMDIEAIYEAPEL
jgi:uncharacterized phiE125 gp8 family phage protein